SLRTQCSKMWMRCRAYANAQFGETEHRYFNPFLSWHSDRFLLFYRSQPIRFRDGFCKIMVAETLPDDNPYVHNKRVLLSSEDSHLEDPRIFRSEFGDIGLSFIESKHNFETCKWYCRQRA